MSTVCHSNSHGTDPDGSLTSMLLLCCHALLCCAVRSAATQYALLNLLVNTAIIGNYSSLSKSAVPGILSPRTFNGEQINLLPYFDGTLPTTNAGGSSGSQVNWLDGGGTAPLLQNQPANSTSASQYALFTHVYSYFGSLLGCSGYNTTGFPVYQGQSSMYQGMQPDCLSPLHLAIYCLSVY